jgi:hypothetical protein
MRLYLFEPEIHTKLTSSVLMSPVMPGRYSCRRHLNRVLPATTRLITMVTGWLTYTIRGVYRLLTTVSVSLVVQHVTMA